MAIDDLLDEHEQSERVRNWLRSNGGGILGGILLGLAAIGGWQWWQKSHHHQRAQASDRYHAALQALEDSDPSKAKAQLSALKDTPYATLAALALAKKQAEAGQRDEAIATLRGARDGAGELEAVVLQRLARLLVDAGKPQEALALLGGANAGGTTPGMLEVRGDAELAAGKQEAARESYRKALAEAPEGSPQRRLLELKLSDVGGATADAPATPANSATSEAKS